MHDICLWIIVETEDLDAPLDAFDLEILIFY